MILCIVFLLIRKRFQNLLQLRQMGRSGEAPKK